MTEFKYGMRNACLTWTDPEGRMYTVPVGGTCKEVNECGLRRFEFTGVSIGGPEIVDEGHTPSSTAPTREEVQTMISGAIGTARASSWATSGSQ